MNSKIVIAVLALTALTALTACSSNDATTRDFAPVDAILNAGMPTETYAVGKLDVVVPRSLKVSEANSLIPRADIVWRGDSYGDRYKQVEQLFEDSVAAADLTSGRKVDVTIEVVRFHGLTEKARYVTGGMYAMHFWLTLTDPATGEVLEHKFVRANLPQAGGAAAVVNDRIGRSEKVVVETFLKREIAEQLGHPV